LLLGEHEQLNNPRRVLARAKRAKPDIEAHLIPNADHLANITAADEVTARLCDFLRR